jgi:hypothetical protein
MAEQHDNWGSVRDKQQSATLHCRTSNWPTLTQTSHHVIAYILIFHFRHLRVLSFQTPNLMEIDHFRGSHESNFNGFQAKIEPPGQKSQVCQFCSEYSKLSVSQKPLKPLKTPQIWSNLVIFVISGVFHCFRHFWQICHFCQNCRFLQNWPFSSISSKLIIFFIFFIFFKTDDFIQFLKNLMFLKFLDFWNILFQFIENIYSLKYLFQFLEFSRFSIS